MKKSKFIALLLALVLVFVACQPSKKTEKEDGKKAEVTKEVTEPTKIVFWHGMNGAQEEALKKLTADFMKANKNITVDLQNQTGYKELQQKITATTTSPKDLPTLTQAYPDWMFNPISDGLVADLSEFTKSLKDYDDILEGFRKGTVIDGKVYSIPFNKSTEVLFYNEDAFKKLGLKVPTNMEEVVTVAKEYHKKTGNPAFGFDSLSNYYTTMLNVQGQVFDDKFDPTSEASKKAVNYYLDGVKKGYFRIAGTDKYMSVSFGNQQVIMYVGSNAGESYVLEGTKGKFTPKAAKSPFSPTIQQGTDLYVFNSASDQQKAAAYKYLEFLTNTENQANWAVATGYIPVRKSAIESSVYQKSKSMIAPILKDATEKLYSNPVLKGANSAYKEAGTVLEDILANPNKVDVDAKLNTFKTTLEGLWN